MQNFYDLLQDGGQLCIVDLDKEDGSFHSQESNFLGYNGFEQKELSQLLEQVGFNNIMSETFYNDENNKDLLIYCFFTCQNHAQQHKQPLALDCSIQVCAKCFAHALLSCFQQHLMLGQCAYC